MTRRATSGILPAVFLICALVSGTVLAQVQARIASRSGDAITLSVGSQDGVRVGMTGSVVQVVVAGGTSQRLQIARFAVEWVGDTSCQAKLTQVGEGFEASIVAGLDVRFDQPLAPRASPAPSAARKAEASATEIAYWESIKNSKDARDFEAYLRRFPAGTFSDLARNRLDSLGRRTDKPPTAQANQAWAERALPTPDPQPMEQARQLETLLAQDPNNYDTLVHMGNLHYDMGNFVRAREYYERARAIRDDSPDVLTDLGVCYRDADPRKALDMFARAAALSPTHWQSRFNSMVVLYSDLKDVAGARRQLEELKRIQATVPGIPPLTLWEQELAKAGP